MVSAEGEALGEHQGLMYHTLGQRKGLHIGGLKNHGDNPWYVVDKDVATNTLIVGQGADHPRLYSKGLIANQLDWVDRAEFSGTCRMTLKTRYRQQDIPASVSSLGDGRVEVIFDSPQKAVTPGQSAVFYEQEVCLGGGIIESYIR